MMSWWRSPLTLLWKGKGVDLMCISNKCLKISKIIPRDTWDIYTIYLFVPWSWCIAYLGSILYTLSWPCVANKKYEYEGTYLSQIWLIYDIWTNIVIFSCGQRSFMVPVPEDLPPKLQQYAARIQVLSGSSNQGLIKKHGNYSEHDIICACIM